MLRGVDQLVVHAALAGHAADSLAEVVAPLPGALAAAVRLVVDLADHAVALRAERILGADVGEAAGLQRVDVDGVAVGAVEPVERARVVREERAHGAVGRDARVPGRAEDVAGAFGRGRRREQGQRGGGGAGRRQHLAKDCVAKTGPAYPGLRERTARILRRRNWALSVWVVQSLTGCGASVRSSP